MKKGPGTALTIYSKHFLVLPCSSNWSSKLFECWLSRECIVLCPVSVYDLAVRKASLKFRCRKVDVIFLLEIRGIPKRKAVCAIQGNIQEFK